MKRMPGVICGFIEPVHFQIRFLYKSRLDYEEDVWKYAAEFVPF